MKSSLHEAAGRAWILLEFAKEKLGPAEELPLSATFHRQEIGATRACICSYTID
jgi:hypothetical protein